MGRRLDAMPDRIDIRDWLYRPTLAPLPNTVVNCKKYQKSSIKEAKALVPDSPLQRSFSFISGSVA
jgi:hypothetical protein